MCNKNYAYYARVTFNLILFYTYIFSRARILSTVNVGFHIAKDKIILMFLVFAASPLSAVTMVYKSMFSNTKGSMVVIKRKIYEEFKPASCGIKI